MKKMRCLFGRLFALLFFLFAGLPGTVARAHQIQVEPCAVVIRPRETFIQAEFKGNVQDITQIPAFMATPADYQGDSFTPEYQKKLEGYFNENFLMVRNGEPLAGTLESVTYEDNNDPTRSKYTVILRYPLKRAVKAEERSKFTITATLFDYLPDTLTTVNIGGFQRNLTSGQSMEVDPKDLAGNLLRNVTDFLVQGILHIVTGYDHICFILALLLVATSLKDLIKTLTGFTLAHSVTLILSTLGVVTLPGKLVEVFVALSIIYVAVENLFLKSTGHRFWIASGFGLVHGFAFAGNLRELGLPEGNALFWSLLSFNVGVEAAQVIICASLFPLLVWWRKEVAKRERAGGMKWQSVLTMVSGAVAAAGGYFLIRSFIG